MKLLLACLLAASTAVPAIAQKKAARTVEITGTDNMKFDKTTIEARPGETLRVVLKSIGKAPKTIMGHNFVLLKLGNDVDAFNQAAFNARDTEFIPPAQKTKVIANTALVGPDETVEVTFTVPAKAGSYDYICSFPGHFAMGMKGKLVVK
jgi:azurin